MTAKMAVGTAVPDVHTGTVDLVQLHRNRRKRADKTSCRKQPRLRYVAVDVEPADDSDDDVASLLIAAVTGLSQSSETASLQSSEMSECDMQQVAESDFGLKDMFMCLFPYFCKAQSRKLNIMHQRLSMRFVLLTAGGMMLNSAVRYYYK